jgi:hypothetical protein
MDAYVLQRTSMGRETTTLKLVMIQLAINHLMI